ncbi:MAG: 5-(carboxyamino)imidazole ribonucleotide mutase [archaeon]|nr:5-(carboxyamino)imidazole ribonucleotide mutase [archaeon]
MEQVLVIFGSESDATVYNPILSGLREKGVKTELRICSAHRTPEKLQHIIKETSADLIIAGAGLSAALPGVIASHSIKPVIGVPVDGNYGGLDALLSIHQMPGGMPVLGTGVNSVEETCEAVAIALKKHKSVKILNRLGENNSLTKRIYSGVSILEELGVGFSIVEDIGLKFDVENEILINLHEFGQSLIEREGALIINVPILKDSTPSDSIKLLEESKTGLWVGLNRVDNACLGAVQLLNIGFSGFSRKIGVFREKQKQKVLESDERERKK